MSGSRVGAVTIGQTPRPDLLEPLVRRLGPTADVVEAGALDGLAADGLPSTPGGIDSAAASPLTTRLRDGSRVTLEESDLAPLVQAAIDRAEAAGAAVILLLCAGGFPHATARGHLVRPFEAAVDRLRELGARRLTVVVPFAGQAEPARRKWTAAGFAIVVLVGDPAVLDVAPGEPGADAIVLDYVGHAGSVVERLRVRAALPVIDLGEAGADAAVAAVEARTSHGAVAVR